MQIADHHTYFVGDDRWGWEVWSHNLCWTTAREAFWKNEAANALASGSTKYSAYNLARMAEGLAPQILVKILKKGKEITGLVSMELHHTFLPQRLGSKVANEMWNLTAASPWSHAAMDPFRKTGSTLISIIKGMGTV